MKVKKPFHLVASSFSGGKGPCLFLLFLFLTFWGSGCVKRELIIRSEPPGARVYFNNVEKGETPVSFDFEWYWKHAVRLEKEGYQPLERIEKVSAPFYMWIPLDLLMEILPFTVRDTHELSYTLEPVPP